MGILAGILLALVGVLGASSLIIARKPDAAEIIGRIAPYQGWIGALSAAWGAWGLISSLMTIEWLETIPLYWVTLLAGAVLQIGLGLLLGVGVLKTFIKDPGANEKMDRTIARLTPYQGTMGLAAIALGIWMVVASLFFSARAVI